MDNSIKNALHNWIPYRLIYEKSEVLSRWLYVKDQSFTDPFFDETILKCMALTENSKPYKCVSEISMITEWAAFTDSIEPTAFIFHVSRCGSTLVSQALGINEENISLSEVPVFDEILRMPFKNCFDKRTSNELLAAAIKFYGSKRNGNRKRLFIKTDSWHLLFYEQLRALYPSTPFIILYRQPAEVLFSQQRQKGMHAVPGMIEPAVFAFEQDFLNNILPADYMSFVLEKYYRVIIEMVENDKNILLVNYNEGISRIIQKIAVFTGMELNVADKESFLERSRYHAKSSTEIFIEKYPAGPVTSPNMASLQNLYQQIEKIRSAV